MIVIMAAVVLSRGSNWEIFHSFPSVETLNFDDHATQESFSRNAWMTAVFPAPSTVSTVFSAEDIEIKQLILRYFRDTGLIMTREKRARNRFSLH